MKKIFVTGAKGFIRKNLIAELRNRDDIFEFDIETEAINVMDSLNTANPNSFKGMRCLRYTEFRKRRFIYAFAVVSVH